MPPNGGLSATTFAAFAQAPAHPFKTHRTGDVAQIAASATPWGVAAIRKRFWYPRASDRWNGVFRTTFAARSRVAGEAAALERLARLGLQPPLLLAWGEARRHGFLHDSFLYLREIESESLDHWFAAPHEPAARLVTLAALARFVAALGRARIVDRDLHLRNFLRRPDGTLSKIDSPFARVVGGAWGRRGRARDLADLERDLAAALSETEFAEWRRALSRSCETPPSR